MAQGSPAGLEMGYMSGITEVTEVCHLSGKEYVALGVATVNLVQKYRDDPLFPFSMTREQKRSCFHSWTALQLEVTTVHF